MKMQNKRLISILVIVAILLLTPLIAMQFTDEVNWTLLDFVVGGVLLLGAGLMFEIVLRIVKETKHRVALSVAILVSFLIVWAELAVGIFGTPFAGS